MDVFEAIEHYKLPELRDCLEAGQDPNGVRNGRTLLQQAIDIEIDSFDQTGIELRVDATLLLLIWGADPDYVPHGGPTPLHYAFTRGHWLAEALFEFLGRLDSRPAVRQADDLRHRCVHCGKCIACQRPRVTRIPGIV